MPILSAVEPPDLAPRFTVCVFDFVPVPAAAMRAAIGAASDVYRLAGVPSEWLLSVPSREPNVPYRFPPGRPPLQMKVLASPARSAAVSGSAFGFALQPEDGHSAFLAYAFYRRIEAAANAHDSPPGLLLGVVMAHEVGHLLGLEESDGIMHGGFTREDLRRAQVGLLRFGSADAARLRTVCAR